MFSKLKSVFSANLTDNNGLTLSYHNARGNATEHTIYNYSGNVTIKNKIDILTIQPGEVLSLMMIGLEKTSKDNATLTLTTYIPPPPAKTGILTDKTVFIVGSVLILILAIIIILLLRSNRV